MANKIKSFHNFILPFIIAGEWDSSKLSKDWKELLDSDDFPCFSENENSTPYSYAFKRYFNKEAKKIIYDDSNLVKNYSYKKVNKQDFFYRISRFYDEELRYYDLKIKSITLRFFPTLNSACLVFSLENTKYKNLEDIKAINQFGRRIYSPFYSNDLDSLETPNNIEILNKEEIKVFPKKTDKYRKYKIMDAPLEILKNFFDLPEDRIFPEKILPKTSRDNSIYLDILIDDRMFVQSFVQSKQFDSLIKPTVDLDNFYKEINENGIKDLKQLYAWVFIDKEEATCQSNNMLYQELSRTLYTRWSGWGSLYLVTPHSLLYLSSSETTPPYLIEYFLTEYLEIILITLSQRLGILKFSYEANEKVKNKPKEIVEFQEKYVEFKNQFMLSEISAQEQGVEIYQLLQNNLYFSKHKEILDNQLTSLYEISQNKMSTKLSCSANVIAVASLIIAIASFIDTIKIQPFFSIILVILTVVICCATFRCRK